MKKLLLLLLLSLGFVGSAYADLKNDLISKTSSNSFKGIVQSSGNDVPVITSFHITNSGKIEGSYTIYQFNTVTAKNSFDGKLYQCFGLSSQKLNCKWKDKFGEGALELSFSSDFNSFSGYWYFNLWEDWYPWDGKRVLKTKKSENETKIPPNAHKFGNGWQCDTGYVREQNYCMKQPANSTAYSTEYSSGWYCNYGWIRVGNICEIHLKGAEPKKIVDNDKVYSAASGSGFAVTSDGYVVTNYHVIEGCTDVKIHDKGKSILATIITFDPLNDIALLKGDFKPRSFYPLSRKTPQLLMDIYAAGFPFGQDMSTSVKVTQGIISSLTGVANNFSNLQISAALQPGNSGGPIVNEKGNVIGVAVAKLDLEKIVDDYGVVPENVNFGVKSNLVINILESENIKLPTPNINAISTSELGELITDGTYYLSCWMTLAQIKQMIETKVMFSNLK